MPKNRPLAGFPSGKYPYGRNVSRLLPQVSRGSSTQYFPLPSEGEGQGEGENIIRGQSFYNVNSGN